jgi:hypothetical protein
MIVGVGVAVSGGGPDFAAIASLAESNGGIYLRVQPENCFQEATATATTPSVLDGVVGCIRMPGATLRAVAFDAARRGTLKRDWAGNYYILATGAAYIIRNSAGVAWDPTVEWTVIEGSRGSGTGTLFCWNRNTSGAGTARFETQDASTNGGNFSQFRRQNNTTGTVANTPNLNYIVTPNVMRIVKTLADMYAFCGDATVRAATGPTIPDDDTAEVREVGLFMTRTGVVNTSYSGGRLYSFFMVPGVLGDADAATVTAAALYSTVPTRMPYAVDANPVILDFENDEFEWGGAARALTDLTDNGDGSYTLNFVDWWNYERTFVVDLEPDAGAGSWTGTFVTLNSENTTNEQFMVDTATPSVRAVYRGHVRNGANTITAFWTRPAIDVKRFRASLVLKSDSSGAATARDGLVQSNTQRGFPGFGPTSITLRPQVTGWKMTRVAMYGKAMTDAELAPALADGITPVVHELGDSFVGWNNGGFARELEAVLATDGLALLHSDDGVGGVGFVGTTNQHRPRFALTPRQWGKTLILNDGGFEYTDGEGPIRAALEEIIGRLTPTGTKRYIYMEPNPINPVGDSRNTDWQAAAVWMKDELGADRYAYTLEPMFCLEDGSANDRTDVANGIWPRSTRSDSTHYLPAGQVLYAKAAVGLMKDLGFIPGSTTVPGTVQSLSATGLVITWSAPASDGGHPIQGYIVQRDVSGTWTTQTPQGSATGYTKQYLRTWTAPATGAYRVAAITHAGTGAYTEVTVI